MKHFALFSLQDILKVDSAFVRNRLTYWQKTGLIRKVRRGFYVFSDMTFAETDLFHAANRLYAPSYISLESALSRYSLIPEGVYAITSVGPLKTSTFSTPLGTFEYRTVKPSAYFGYRVETQNGRPHAVAEPEKAVLDYLYLHPEIAEPGAFEQWRLDSAGFLQLADEKKFLTYADAYGIQSFSARARALLDLIHASA